jgi:hypothetical protein
VIRISLENVLMNKQRILKTNFASRGLMNVQEQGSIKDIWEADSSVKEKPPLMITNSKILQESKGIIFNTPTETCAVLVKKQKGDEESQIIDVEKSAKKLFTVRCLTCDVSYKNLAYGSAILAIICLFISVFGGIMSEPNIAVPAGILSIFGFLSLGYANFKEKESVEILLREAEQNLRSKIMNP